MPNWVQLVEFTAEHSCVPWSLRCLTARGDGGYLLFTRDCNLKELPIAIIHSIGLQERASSSKEAARWEPETEANARLMLDAPAMLALLARFVCEMQVPETLDGAGAKRMLPLFQEAEKLLRRHVRIGCVPVDVESRGAPPVPCSPEEMEKWLKQPWE